ACTRIPRGISAPHSSTSAASPNEPQLRNAHPRTASFFLTRLPPPSSTLFPYTTLFRSFALIAAGDMPGLRRELLTVLVDRVHGEDRKSTRLNSSHVALSYAAFCSKKKRRSGSGSPATASTWRRTCSSSRSSGCCAPGGRSSRHHDGRGRGPRRRDLRRGRTPAQSCPPARRPRSGSAGGVPAPARTQRSG